MHAPVTEAAKNPARDLRGASGSRSNGTLEGSFGVYEPKRRPTVDAAVSAHERLEQGRCELYLKCEGKVDKHKNSYCCYVLRVEREGEIDS